MQPAHGRLISDPLAFGERVFHVWRKRAAMLIEHIIKRAGGTEIPMPVAGGDDITYHFQSPLTAILTRRTSRKCRISRTSTAS